MRTPAQAVLWELWQLSRGDILVRGVGLTVSLAGTLYLAGSLGIEPRSMVPFVLLILGATGVLSGLWMNGFDNSRNGFTLYLGFARPISTLLLVAVPMLYIASSSALCCVVPGALLGWLFDIPLGLLPLATLVATVSVCFAAALWCSQTTLAKVVSLSAVWGGLSAAGIPWLKGRMGTPRAAIVGLPADGPTGVTFSGVHYSALFLVGVCAVSLTVFAVDRQRHGEGLHLKGFGGVLRNLADRLPRWSRPFSWPAGAQFWFEMRRSGVGLLWMSLSAAVVLLLIVSSLHLQEMDFGAGSVVIWMSALALCPVVCLVLGAERLLGLQRKQGRLSLSSFDATRPMRNDSLMATKLVVLTTCVLLSWVGMACAATVSTILWGGAANWLQAAQRLGPVLSDVPGPWWVVIAIVVGVLYLCSGAMVLVAGLWLPLHRRRFLCAGAVLAGHVFLAIWDGSRGGELEPLWTLYGCMVPVVMGVVTVVALRRALRWGFLGRRSFIAVLGIWAIFACAAVGVYLRFGSAHGPNPLLSLPLGAGVLMLPLAAAAFAPLAMASHRHR